MKERKRSSYELREAQNRKQREDERRDLPRKERKALKKEEKLRAKKKRAVNKEFARVTYIFVGLFLVLMGYIAYFNVVTSKEIISSAYNPRLDSMAEHVIRGKILDREGNILAETQTGEDGSESRNYPYGNIFAHAVGYSSQGKSGIESVSNFDLLTSNAFFLEKLKNEFQDQKNIGDNIVTTLDAGLQESAYNALGDNNGAVVIMEASTGKILTMLSKPAFDPNSVAADWDWLTSDENSILLNRATQGQYAPGSTFKIVTALEYMREHSDYPNYAYLCGGEITHEGTTIECANHNVHGEVNLASSFAYSCNSSFCNIGLGLHVSEYRNTAKGLLFDSKLPSTLPYSKSKFTLTSKDSDSAKMMTAMGQGNTQVSPYHMALITSAIANGGILMQPYMIDSVTNYNGTIVDKSKPEQYKELMTSQEAMQLKEYMKEVTEYGTASIMAGEAYTVAGKTGTAEYNDEERNHSWFVGFTNVDNPELVVSVLVEGTDGSTKAVNVAKQIFDNYYY